MTTFNSFTQEEADALKMKCTFLWYHRRDFKMKQVLARSVLSIKPASKFFPYKNDTLLLLSLLYSPTATPRDYGLLMLDPAWFIPLELIIGFYSVNLNFTESLQALQEAVDSGKIDEGKYLSMCKQIAWLAKMRTDFVTQGVICEVNTKTGAQRILTETISDD